MAAIIVNNRIVTFGIPTRTYTKIEQDLLNKLKTQTPIAWLKNFNEVNDLDMRLLALADTALTDINSQTPTTGYNIGNYPANWTAVIVMGFQVQLAIFMAMRWSLIDLTYSDSGLSIQVIRTEKLSAMVKMLDDRYQRMLLNIKKGLLLQQGGMVLVTPRWQASTSRMIGMLGDGAYGWGMV